MRKLALVLILVLLGAVYFVFHQFTPPAEDRYPEFRGVSAVRKQRVLAALSKQGIMSRSFQGVVPADVTPLALLAGLCKSHPKPANFVRHNTYFTDPESQRFGWFIAEKEDDSLNPLLVRILEDRRLGAPPRQAAAVALCRPGNDEVLPALTEFLLDPDRDHTMRGFLLERLHRIGVPPGPRFHDLLLIPYDRLDLPAAATLALVGEPVAPSLVRQGLPGNYEHPDGETHLIVGAAAAIAADDPELRALVAQTLQALEKSSWSSAEGETMEETQARRKGYLEAITERFDAWLAAHPDALRTGFETARAEYRESDRRKREAAISSFEDVLATPEEDLDFAAAALLVAGWSRKFDELNLDRLDRLAVLFRRELEGITDPEETLAVLNERLLTRHKNIRGWNLENGPSSFLADVLRHRAGNCIGLVSLYVALGDRLDLPLVAVLIPRHVYLRWDDGQRRLDFELTDMGRRRTEEELDGAVPRVLGTKALLSRILSNRSAAWLESPWVKDEGRTRYAIEFAEQALLLDEKNASGHLSLAQALVADDVGNAERAFDAIRTAIALDPTDPTARMVGAQLLLSLQRPDESLEWYEQALAAEPDHIVGQIGRLQALQAVARHEEVVRDADAFLERWDEEGPIRPVRRIRFVSLLRLGSPRWPEEFEGLPDSTVDRWALTLDTAEILLTDDRPVPADPETALRLLRELTELTKQVRDLDSSSHAFIKDGADGVNMVPRENVAAYWKRATGLEAEALEKLGREDEARRVRERIGD